jgi:hypothetical protein
VPTDHGPADCPDCGGAGLLPPAETLIEWRLREIERAHELRHDDTAKDVRWLAFELRRARDALTELLTLADELDHPIRARMHSIANRAIGFYEIEPEEPSPQGKP